MKAIVNARRKRDLGTLNPIPYAVTVANCVGWTMYGCMRRDYFIFFSNSTGLVLGLFYSLSSLTLLDHKKSDLFRLQVMTSLLVSSAIFWCLMGMIACIAYPADPASREQGTVFIGTLGMGFGLAYYTAPLSTMAQVIKMRDSSSLYLPLIVSSFCNAFLWVIYGFVVKHDLAIWLPNGVGVVLSTIQFALKMLFPSRSNPNSEVGSSPVPVSDICEADEKGMEMGVEAGQQVENPLHQLGDRQNETAQSTNLENPYSNTSDEFEL